MFDMRLFRIRAFAAGDIASLLASIGRGGLMFPLIIWLQGIWLPLHGYSYASTPCGRDLRAAAHGEVPPVAVTLGELSSHLHPGE